MPLVTTTYKDRREAEVTGFLGLRSDPESLIPPDALITAGNFYFSQPRVLRCREGVLQTFYTFDEGHSYCSSEFTTTSGTTYLVFVKNRRVYYWNGSNLSVLIYGGTEDFLSSGAVERGIVEYNNCVYVSDGSQYIYKWDGANVTRIEVPLTGTYGNPVNIFNFGSSLGVVTDKSYLRYTQVGSDTVWEERVILPGTISATGTTVTGTNTIFTSTNITKGLRVIISDGTNEESRYILSIGSDSSITLNEALSNSYSAGSSIYLAGLDLYEPLDVNDGLIPRKAITFGKFLAVSKSADDTFRSDSKLLVYSISTRDPNASQLASSFNDTGIKFLSQQSLAQTFNIHPFSLTEYDGTAVFLSDDNLYGLAQSTSNSDKFEAVSLSGGKLEKELENINRTKRNNSQISIVRKGNINLLCIHFTEDIGSSYNNRILAGYQYEDKSFEFTNLHIPTKAIDASSLSLDYDHSHFVKYKDKIFLIGKQCTVEAFNESYKLDTLVDGDLSSLLISSGTALISSGTILISGYYPPTTANLAIQRSLRFGTFSNENHNKLSLYRFYLTVSETKATTALSSLNYYLRFYFNGSDPGEDITREYDADNTVNVVTFDDDVAGTNTMDSTSATPWNFSDDYPAATQFEPLQYRYQQKKITNLSLQVFDYESDGILEVRAYGVILSPTKYQ